MCNTNTCCSVINTRRCCYKPTVRNVCNVPDRTVPAAPHRLPLPAPSSSFLFSASASTSTSTSFLSSFNAVPLLGFALLLHRYPSPALLLALVPLSSPNALLCSLQSSPPSTRRSYIFPFRCRLFPLNPQTLFLRPSLHFNL